MVPAQAKSPPAGNVFWKSNAWKRQVIQDVAMLPRADMWKPQSGQGGRIRMDVALTDIQEAKQVTYSAMFFNHYDLFLDYKHIKQPRIHTYTNSM